MYMYISCRPLQLDEMEHIIHNIAPHELIDFMSKSIQQARSSVTKLLVPQMRLCHLNNALINSVSRLDVRIGKLENFYSPHMGHSGSDNTLIHVCGDVESWPTSRPLENNKDAKWRNQLIMIDGGHPHSRADTLEFPTYMYPWPYPHYSPILGPIHWNSLHILGPIPTIAPF